MTSNSRSPLKTLTVAALLVAGVALAGCGRKGGLDLPPNAGVQPEPPAAGAAPASAADKGEALFNPAVTRSDFPIAPKGEKKKFVLDPLLD
ncbi:MAG TPA: lipoprotein [Xanthobacteraceae bacterium]|nr:lipoprotein [Xanthobacteraceae bacterium]